MPQFGASLTDDSRGAIYDSKCVQYTGHKESLLKGKDQYD